MALRLGVLPTYDVTLSSQSESIMHQINSKLSDVKISFKFVMSLLITKILYFSLYCNKKFNFLTENENRKSAFGYFFGNDLLENIFSILILGDRLLKSQFSYTAL